MFCNVCLDALEHRKGFIDTKNATDSQIALLAHHKSAKSLESSALDACELCHPFWCKIDETSRSRMRKLDSQWVTQHGDVLDPCRPHDHELQDTTGFVTLCLVNNSPECRNETLGVDMTITIVFERGYRREIPKLDDITGLFVVCRGSAAESGRRVPFFSDNMASVESLRKARKWIQKCTSSHRACNIEANADSWHPTRLLDLMGPVGQDTFRIVDSSGLGVEPKEKYMTLSHCWGTAQFLQLNKSTHDELRGGVSLQRLPKTFQDAVQVTRQLGVRYLWIDSLCILQDRDDLSDWLVEAAQMHKVYSNSFCNISAASAEDSSKGLYCDKNPQLGQSSTLRLCVKGLGFSPEVDSVPCYVVDLLFWVDRVSKCTLNTRGWVLQERLLSPRILHFARDQLIWECRELSAAECYPERLPPQIKNTLPSTLKRLDPESHNMDLKRIDTTSDHSTFYYNAWNSIIEAYSSTRLTKSSDKLIALSGVAKHFRKKIKDTYVVGMWKECLASSLLWRVERQSQVDGSPSTRPETYRAPSFSWMAVDGMVSTQATEAKDNMLMEVISFHIDYVTDDDTGLVSGGHVYLRGQIRPFRMIAKNVSPNIRRLFMEVDSEIVKASTKGTFEYGPSIYLDVGQASFDHENIEETLYYMPAKKSHVDINEDRHCSYLLLVALDKDKSVFQRIGLALTNDDEEIEMLQGRSAASFRFQGVELEPDPPTGMCIIRVV